MFRNVLSYYHGTTDINWQEIQNCGRLIPSSERKMCKYWIAKGVYFVAENPFLALWYAWITAFHNNSKIKGVCKAKNAHAPVVLKISYAIDDCVLNLITSKGHMLYHDAHCRLKGKLRTTHLDVVDNIDCYVGSGLLESQTHKAIMAAFNEGKSFQKLIQDSRFINSSGYNGHKYGDHVEICFREYTNLDSITLHRHCDIVDIGSEGYWDHLCMALTECLPKSGKLKAFMREQFYSHLLSQVTL